MNKNANTENSQAAEIWAMLKETARRQEETVLQMKETDRRLEKQMKETDRRLEKQMKETDRRLGKQFGDLGNRFGEVIEHLLSPGLQEKFLAFGYKFDQVHRDSKIKNIVTKQTIAEIDVLFTDGKYDMAVEVKTKPGMEDVDGHVARVKKIRAYYDSKGRDRKILGAVAGAVFPKNVRDYAVKNGFFAVCQSGDTVSINVPEGFKPREW